MDIGEFIFGVGAAIEWRAKHMFVVKQMNQIDYIMPERENFREIDLTKSSTG